MTDTTAVKPDEPGLSDLVEIYYAPKAVFARRAEGAEFGVALVVLAIAMTAIYYATLSAMQPVMDAEWKRMLPSMMKKMPTAPPEMFDRIKEAAPKWAGIGLFLVGSVGPLLAGLVLWIASKVVGIRETLGQAMMVATFALYPMLVELLVNALQALVLPDGAITSRYSVSLGPARFLDSSAGMTTMAALGHIDLFTIWMAALMAIGLKVTARASTAQAVSAAAIVWLVGMLPALLGALRAG